MKILVLVLIVAVGGFFVGRYQSGDAETPAPTPVATPAQTRVIIGPLGDANCDGIINAAADALALLQAVGGLPPATVSPWRPDDCAIGEIWSADTYWHGYDPINP